MTETTWGTPREVTVTDLKAGDFVVSIPQQDGIRGYTVNSGIKEIGKPEYGKYVRKTRTGYRRVSRQDVMSRRVTFLDPKLTVLHLPVSHRLIVRVAGE